MIQLKTARELERMRKACRISAQALQVAQSVIKAGVSTAYVDEQVRKFIVSQGARPTFLNYGGFPGSACVSVNEELIHGIPSRHKIIQEGDIVSVDVGAFIDGYTGDNAATFPVGEVSEEAKKLLRVTKESLERAVAQAVAGNRLGDIGHAVQSHVEENGFSVVREYVGHGVGRELHEDPEVPNFGRPGHGVRLVPGMTIAIEPMVNAGGREIEVLANDWTVVTVDRRLSAHFEYTVAITDDGPVVLTRA
jgi:methionyl aminopeptidase